jgi:Rod binding domain-containing protein
MDLGVAQTLAATSGANDLAGLSEGRRQPGRGAQGGQQFGALMMQNLMRQSDGTALPMVDGGAGSDVVNQMFSGTISRAVMATKRWGLTDLLLRSMQKNSSRLGRRRCAGADGVAEITSRRRPAIRSRSRPIGRTTACGRSPPRSRRAASAREPAPPWR